MVYWDISYYDNLMFIESIIMQIYGVLSDFLLCKFLCIESIIMQIYGVLSDFLLCNFFVYWVNYYADLWCIEAFLIMTI
jgi:hypothetical protein